MEKCNKIKVPIKTCMLEFGKGQEITSEKYLTCRNETMLINMDIKNRVVSIELLSNKKPCQKSEH